jgi:hypothetical protein
VGGIEKTVERLPFIINDEAAKPCRLDISEKVTSTRIEYPRSTVLEIPLARSAVSLGTLKNQWMRGWEERVDLGNRKPEHRERTHPLVKALNLF